MPQVVEDTPSTSADLSVTGQPPRPGIRDGTITCTFTVRNDGPDPAEHTTFVAIPDGAGTGLDADLSDGVRASQRCPR